jgi:hypothetical protein
VDIYWGKVRIIKPVDGVATSKYTDKVFKIPGKWGSQPQAFVFPGGDVGLCVGGRYQTMAMAINKLTNPDYIYGWMTLEQLNKGWSSLFQMISHIK